MKYQVRRVANQSPTSIDQRRGPAKSFSVSWAKVQCLSTEWIYTHEAACLCRLIVYLREGIEVYVKMVLAFYVE